MLRVCLRDGPAALRYVEASGALAAEHGFSFWLAGAEVLRGWARAECGAEDGVDQLRHGLRDWLMTGSVTYHTYYLGLLAEVLLRRGRADAARPVLEEALALA